MEQSVATLERPVEGSSASPVHPEEPAAWNARPGVALLLRAAIFVAPILASVLVSYLIARMWTRPEGLVASSGWFLVLIVAGGLAMLAIDRVARRFLPLTALLRMTLIFPDQAPSRFNVAIRTGTTKQLERRLEHVQEFGLGETEAEAAETLLHLAAALREHDRFTRGHGERVRAYTALIGEELGLDPVEISKLQWAGLIHDIGKLAVPAEVLNKPGRLTADEYDVIKTHPAEGMAMMGPLTGWLGEWALAVGEHHERWDGAGYPNGLARRDISLAGRIVAVADTFDVITATRSYKPSQSPQWARRELAENAGSQFDPEIVRAFLNISIGKLRSVMWPLSWLASVPLIGSTLTAPATGFAAAAVAVVGSSVTGGNLADAVPPEFGREPVAAVVVDETPAAVTTSTTLVVAGLPPTSTLVVVAEPGAAADQATPIADRSDDSGVGTPSTIVVTIVGSTDDTYPPIVTIPPVTGRIIDPNAPTAPATTLVVTAPGTPVATAPATTLVPGTPTVPSTTAAPTTTTAQTDCARARSGATSLPDADLSDCDLSGLELVGVDLRGADLSHADLREARLTNVDLSGASLAQADLRGAVLTGVTMRGVSATKIDARDASWEGVDATDSTLTKAKFNDSRLTDVTFAMIRATNIDFAAARLVRVSFVDAHLNDAIFDDAVLIDVKMQRASARGSSFDGAEARWIDFSDADLRASELDGAILSNAVLGGVRIGSAVLGQTDFRGATGKPDGAASAGYDATICPDGSVRSSNCWP